MEEGGGYWASKERLDNIWTTWSINLKMVHTEIEIIN